MNKLAILMAVAVALALAGSPVPNAAAKDQYMKAAPSEAPKTTTAPPKDSKKEPKVTTRCVTPDGKPKPC
jgi:hypothetical protein